MTEPNVFERFVAQRYNLAREDHSVGGIVDHRPIHLDGEPLNDVDGWWACTQPERPHVDGATWYDYRCHKCRIAFDAAVAQGTLTAVFSMTHDGRIEATWTPTQYKAMAAVALGREW